MMHPLNPLEAVGVPEGEWVQVRPPLSVPTRFRGDWTAYPHFSSKENWKRTMEPRVTELMAFLEGRLGIGVYECEVCKKAGRGMQSGFVEHIIGKAHFKHLGQYELPAGVPVEESKQTLWLEWAVPGGALRFNGGDGIIEMYRGNGPPPPPNGAAPAAAPALGVAPGPGFGPGPCPGGGPVAGWAVPGSSTLSQAGSQAGPARELPGVEDVPRDNEWFMVSEMVGMPPREGATLQDCGWLATRNTWKQAFVNVAPKLAVLLRRYNIWEPGCKACANGQDFETHVPAQKHIDSLRSQIPPDVPIKDISYQWWQQWNVPGGSIRFNHVHGSIEVWRGWPPLEERRLPAENTFPPNLASLRNSVPPSVASISPNMLPATDIRLREPPTPAPAPGCGGEVLKYMGDPRQVMVTTLNNEGTWFRIGDAGFCSRPNGDWNAYPHLSSKTSFKEFMKGRVDTVMAVLQKHQPNFWPECKLCGRSRGFEEHICGPKHFKELQERFWKEGHPMQPFIASEDAWDLWQLPGGALRYNYIDGAVDLCKGPLPGGGGGGGQVQNPPPPMNMQQPGWPPGPPQATRPPGPPGPPQGPSQVSPRGTRPAGPPPGKPPSTNDLRAGGDEKFQQAAGMLCWMWNQRFESETTAISQIVQSALSGKPTLSSTCSICGQSVLDPHHLVHPRHVGSICEKLNFTIANHKNHNYPELKQHWDIDQRRLTLYHFPPKVQWTDIDTPLQQPSLEGGYGYSAPSASNGHGPASVSAVDSARSSVQGRSQPPPQQAMNGWHTNGVGPSSQERPAETPQQQQQQQQQQPQKPIVNDPWVTFRPDGNGAATEARPTTANWGAVDGSQAAVNMQPPDSNATVPPSSGELRGMQASAASAWGARPPESNATVPPSSGELRAMQQQAGRWGNPAAASPNSRMPSIAEMREKKKWTSYKTGDGRTIWKFDENTWFDELDPNSGWVSYLYREGHPEGYFFHNLSTRWFDRESGEDKGLWPA